MILQKDYIVMLGEDRGNINAVKFIENDNKETDDITKAKMVSTQQEAITMANNYFTANPDVYTKDKVHICRYTYYASSEITLDKSDPAILREKALRKLTETEKQALGIS